MSLPNGIICSAEEYHRSLESVSITCLTRADSFGLAAVGMTGFLSLAAIIYFFAIIARNVTWRVRNVAQARLRIFHQPMDILMFSLILGDIVQAIGMAILVKWVHDGKVEVGGFCNVQGVFRVLGSTAVAFSSLTIAVYTFIGVWMQKVLSMGITLTVVAAFWVLDAFLVILGFALNRGHGELSYMAPAPYWCSPNRQYLVWKSFGEYIWMWIALFASILLYVPLYLWMRGNIHLGNVWWNFRFQRADNDPELFAVRVRSLVMLAYPAVYCVLVLPMSVVRWSTFVNDVNSVPSAATFVVVSIFGLSGFVDVILLLTTRPQSGLFGQLMFRAETSESEPQPNSAAVELHPVPAAPHAEPELHPTGGDSDGQIIEQVERAGRLPP